MTDITKTIKNKKNPAMSEKQITTRISAMDNAERLTFLVAMTDVQKIVHEMSEEDRKRIRQFAEVAELLIRMDGDKQKIALALISSGIIESETANSLMKKYNPR